MRLIALYKTLTGGEWIISSLNSICEHVKAIVMVHSTCMWGGKPHNNNCIEPVKEWKEESSQGHRLFELFGAFDTQEEQYKKGWDYIKTEFGDSYILVIDSDEVWENIQLDKLIEKIRQKPHYTAYHCAMRTYVKSPFYRITPPEKCYPTVVINGHKVDKIFGVRGNDLSPALYLDDVFMHHFSYVRRSDDAILEKMQYILLGDKDNYHKDWFEKYWNKIPNVENFHPTIGEEKSWRSIETITLKDLPIAIRKSKIVRKWQNRLPRQLLNVEDDKMVEPEPTKRAVIDVGKPCNLKCSFCYYRYEKPKPFISFETLKQQIIQARNRGNDTIDFTGGEPTIHPQIVELVKVCSDNGMKSCIITNATLLFKNNLLDKFLEAGLSDLLITIQGLEEIHNKSVCARTYDKVIKAINFMHDNNLFYRTNTILTMDTYKGLPELAKLLEEKKPKISNFINFNARYNWTKVDREKIQAKCSDIAPYLKKAISILEAADIGVNVRYFPICLLKGFEKNVCNGSLVVFDPYEWDYGWVPKTIERYKEAGRAICETINSNGLCPECMNCGIKAICGTVDKPYFERFGAEELQPYKEKIEDLYFYRRNNKPITLIQGY